jgi:rubrerythrin
MSTITNYIRDFFHWNNDFVSNQTYKYYYPLYKKLFGVKFVRAWDNLVKEGWIRKSRVELGYFWQIPNPQNECYGCGEKTDKGRFVYLCHKCFERYGDAMSLWYDSFSEDEENPGLPRGEEIMLRLRIGDEITIMTWPLRTPKVVEAFERLGLDVQVENLNTDQDVITLRDKFWLQEENPHRIWANTGITGEGTKTNPLSVMPPTDSPESALRAGILAEMDAINLYEQLAVSPNIPGNIRELFKDIAREEAVHVGEFQRTLESVDKNSEEDFMQGYLEAEEKFLSNPPKYYCDLCEMTFTEEPDQHIEDHHADDPRCAHDDARIVFEEMFISEAEPEENPYIAWWKPKERENPVTPKWLSKYNMKGVSGWDGTRDCRYCGIVQTYDGKEYYFHFKCPECGEEGKSLSWNWNELKDNLILRCSKGHSVGIDETGPDFDEWVVLEEEKK